MIEPPAADAYAAARRRLDALAKPTGALGRLEELAAWVASCQGECPPRPLNRVRAVLLAGDQGVSRPSGSTPSVSAYPREVTPAMVRLLVAGRAAANVLARQHGVPLRVLDLGVDADLRDLPAAVSAYKIRRGSGSIDTTDALTTDEAERALAAGRAIAAEEIAAGADLLVLGDMGIGNTTPAAALVAGILGLEPVVVVGRGTGVDDAGWMRKTTAIRDALRRSRRSVGRDPEGLLRVVGGRDLATMTGLLIQAGARRTPVILDGVVSCAAALAAERMAPGASAWWVAGTRSTEPSQAKALSALGLEPLLDLQLRLGEGTGALLAVNLVQAAAATLAEMATFTEAGVSDKPTEDGPG
jgi:nicotinate-nucleotide--dimethylbenzimidazole phosphoribosyltransferase